MLVDSERYFALVQAGMDEARARDLSRIEESFPRIKRHLNFLIWMFTVNLILTGLLLVFVYTK